MILICAATSTEAKACQAGLALSKNGHSFEVLQTGMGREAARRALQAYVSEQKIPALVISSGFTGSLNPEAHLGSWVCGTSIRNGYSSSQAACTEIPAAIAEALGHLCTYGRVRAVDAVITEHEKRNETGDEAVDMESYGIFDVCRANDIPLTILRCVSDTPSEPLPEAIKTFSAMLLTDSSREKGQAFMQGASQLVRAPKNFALFALKASRLRADLSRGWQIIADNWPMT